MQENKRKAKKILNLKRRERERERDQTRGGRREVRRWSFRRRSGGGREGRICPSR